MRCPSLCQFAVLSSVSSRAVVRVLLVAVIGAMPNGVIGMIEREG